MSRRFDRAGQDLGNLVFWEHINLMVPDQSLTTDFYITALGMTRDPYYMVGTDNFWANLGQQQMHLQSGEAQRFRGEITLVTQDLQALQRRLDNPTPRLVNSRFSWSREGGQIKATCPWGNRFSIVDRRPGFESPRGIPQAVIDVAPGKAEAIAAFYRQVVGALVEVESQPQAEARVTVGPGQVLVFREIQEPLKPYDQHHVCVYAANPGPMYDWLSERGLITLEDNPYQFRFQAIVDPESGETACELEHELRSLHHPFYKRSLINRVGNETLP